MPKSYGKLLEHDLQNLLLLEQFRLDPNLVSDQSFCRGDTNYQLRHSITDPVSYTHLTLPTILLV